MAKTIALIGTLDTKGDQIEYLSAKIGEKGHQVIIMDVGVLGEASIEHSITRHEVAKAAGTTLEIIAALGPGKESEAMEKMAEGTQAMLKDLNEKEHIDSVLSLGGSMGTALALNVMKVLPLAMPKIVLSTIANSPAIDPDLLSHNVLMVPLMGGFWGLNEFAKRSLDQAASLIVGSTETYNRRPITDKKLIGVTSLGMSAARYLYHLGPALNERGYEVAVFHATGMSTRLFEKAVKDGLFDFILDLYAGMELINEICGSLLGPGPHRLEAAAQQGVPQIVSLGIIEMCLWGSYKPIPEEFAGRQILHHNPLLWMTFTNLEEKVTMAKMLAKKLNQAKGPTAIIIPMKPPFGLTKWGVEDSEGLEAVRKTLSKNLKSKVNYVEVDASTDDKEFSDWVLELMDHMMK
jgi:uncharacterized protein (UPF0261 family)